MIDVPSRGDVVQIDSQGWLHDFRQGLLGKKMSLGIALPFAKNLPWNLDAILSKVSIQLARVDLEKIGKSVPLGDLCEVFLGLQHSRTETKSGTGIRVIRGRDLSSESITIEKLSWFKLEGEVPEHVKVRAGDILIQRIGLRPQSLVVAPEMEGAIASDTIAILRPKDSQAATPLISQFLRSTKGQEVIQRAIRGQYAPTLSVSALRTIPIPVLSEHITRELQEIQQIEQDLRIRAEKIQAMRLKLFSAESAEDLEDRLNELRRVANAVAGTLQQAESLEFQVRNLYPFPLAFGYRALSGYTLPQDRFREQLNLAEKILAFLGSLTLSLIDPTDRDASVLSLRDIWQGGLSPGKWREVSQRGAKSLIRYEENRLARNIASLWIEKKQTAFAKCMEELIVIRNDHYHNRGPNVDAEFQKAIVDISKLLNTVMGSVAFLTEFPVRLVRDLNVVRGSRRVTLQTLRYVGDHPGMPNEQIGYPEALPKNDLYIQVRDDHWLPLYPFMTVQDCPRFRYRETYYVDRWDGSGNKAILKSFERGHTEENVDVGNSMAIWQSA